MAGSMLGTGTRVKEFGTEREGGATKFAFRGKLTKLNGCAMAKVKRFACSFEGPGQ